MNKNFLKKTIVTTSLITLLVGGSNVFALDSNPNIVSKDEILENDVESKVSSYSMDTILEDNGFTVEEIDVEDLPSDAQVLKFDSEEEMEKYFESIDAQLNNEQSIETVNNFNTYSPLAIARSSTKIIHKSTSKTYGFGHCNLYANIYVSNNKISKATMSTDLTGYTLGLGWKEHKDSRYVNISGTKKSVTLGTRGTLNTYLITEASKIRIGTRSVPL